MKLEVNRNQLKIIGDFNKWSEQEIAYIEDTLGLKEDGDSILLVRKNYLKSPTLVYLETELNIMTEGGTVWESRVWHGGTWKQRNWDNGIWNGGTWESGNRGNGVWHDGVWENGVWKDGIWKKGVWDDGTWKSGIWEDGTWYDGLWESGTWKSGIWVKGLWESGTWKSGIWVNGEWKSGTWENGLWRLGTWENGTWVRGEIYSKKYKTYIDSKINPKEFYKLEKESTNIDDFQI